MLFSSHPAIELQLEYRDGLCSAGAALAVATHLALCPRCASALSLGSWAGRNLPGVLAADHGPGGEAYANALGSRVLEDWRQVNATTRSAALRMSSSLGEASHLIEAGLGSPMVVPGSAMYVVVLQGTLSNESASFERGAFIDLMALRLSPLKVSGTQGCVFLAISEAE